LRAVNAAKATEYSSFSDYFGNNTFFTRRIRSWKAKGSWHKIVRGLWMDGCSRRAFISS
jgi:hypothetical protein